MRLQSALLVVCAAALAACNDSSTAPTTVNGSLSFNYTGAGASAATTFSANGDVPTSVVNGFGSNSWAAAEVDAANVETDVVAFVPKSSSTWDEAVITVNRTSIGSSTISSSCATSNCPSVTIIFGVSQAQSTYTYLCELTNGSVNISSISSSRVTGSFSGTGTCTNSLNVVSNFTVTSGIFDAGVTTQAIGGV